MTKKTYLFLFLGILCTTMSFAKVKFKQISTLEEWTKTLNEAKSNNQLVFLDIYTDWCGYCKLLDKNTFSNETLSKLYNKEFINIKLDAETTLGEQLCKDLQVTGYPSHAFYDGNKNIILSGSGYADHNYFIGVANNAKNNHQVLRNIEKEFPKKDLANQLVLIQKLQNRELNQKAEELSKTVTSKNSLQDIYNLNQHFALTKMHYYDWAIVKSFLAKENFKETLDTKTEESIAKLYLNQLVNKRFEHALGNNKHTLREDLTLIYSKLLPAQKDFMVAVNMMTFYTENKEIKNLHDEAKVFFTKYKDQNITPIYDAALLFAEHYRSDAEMIKSANSWIEYGVKTNKDLNAYITAGIYYKTLGNKSQAKGNFQKALDTKILGAREAQMVQNIIETL